ncbi:MAG: DUF4292 domain-containing protein [Bacteroidales bacterium]|nr:DUF4292 domain-containing protein [Bacteroidales bacterium]
MKNRYIPLLLIFGALLLTGCHVHKKTVHTDKPGAGTVTPTPPATKYQLKDIKNIEYQTLSCNYSCTVEGFNVSGQMRIMHDSIIWLSINKILEVGRIKLTPTKVEGYISILNKYYSGDYASLSKRWGIDIDYATCEAVLTGNMPPNCTLAKNADVKNDSILFNVNQRGASQRQIALRVPRNTMKINRLELKSPSVGQHLACQYSKMLIADEQALPGYIDVNLKCRRGTIITGITISKPKLNVSQSYPFKIPSRAKPL